MELGTLLGASWAWGINAYLTVLVLGISGRLGWADTPDSLHRPIVLIPAAVMFLIEFVVDKVPYVDNLWDVVQYGGPSHSPTSSPVWVRTDW